MKTYSLNAWCAAACEVKVKAALPSRTICGQKIVTFRRTNASKVSNLHWNDDPDYVFFNLNIDAGSMWARKLNSKMVDAEVSAEPKAARVIPMEVAS